MTLRQELARIIRDPERLELLLRRFGGRKVYIPVAEPYASVSERRRERDRAIVAAITETSSNVAAAKRLGMSTRSIIRGGKRLN